MTKEVRRKMTKEMKEEEDKKGECNFAIKLFTIPEFNNSIIQ